VITITLQGRIEFTDANIAEDLRLEFEGVHFVGNGTIYGFAEPSGSVDSVTFSSLSKH
jgi:transmembrane E3 ubiquitin-protein ligase